MLWLITARQAGEEVYVCYLLGSVSEGLPCRWHHWALESLH